MTKTEKLLASGLVLLLVVLAATSYSLKGDLRELLSKLQQSYAGVTNYDELAPGALAIKTHLLTIDSDASNATSTVFECRDNGENFSRYIDIGGALFIKSGTSTQDRFLVQGATTTQPATTYLGTGSGSALSTGSTTLANTNLINIDMATGTGPFNRFASTTATGMIEWRPATCIGFVVKNPGANVENLLRTATSGVQTGLGKLTLSFTSYATSTQR